jgi:hypothetical protein
MPMQHGLLFLLNLAYSFAEHCKLPSFADVPMKMHDVYHSCSGEYLRGSQYFPSMSLSARPWLPMQLDTYNCGVGITARLPQFFATLLEEIISIMKGTAIPLLGASFSCLERKAKERMISLSFSLNFRINYTTIV